MEILEETLISAILAFCSIPERPLVNGSKWFIFGQPWTVNPNEKGPPFPATPIHPLLEQRIG
jgi:hypothetical protein